MRSMPQVVSDPACAMISAPFYWLAIANSPTGARRRERRPIYSGACHMDMNSLRVEPIVALVAGVLILVQPRLLNYIVAIYLIIVGVVGLAPQLFK